MSNNLNSLLLRISVTISTFTITASLLFYLSIGHLIGFLGFLLIIWISCWSFSRYFVEFLFLKNDIISHINNAVLITGCDSGFGKGTAFKLGDIGYHVFACCFSKETNGYKELLEYSRTSKGKIDLILLDVNSDKSVNDAFQYVKQNLEENEKLFAMVNNAGLGSYHIWNCGNDPVAHYKKIIETNTIGVVRMTYKFTPLLLECPNSPRIIFLSSYAGRLSFSGMVSYCMSKYSIRVFGNCLRRELDHLKIKSIIIEPTMYKTEMTNVESSLKMFDENWNSTDKELQKRIGLDFYNRMREGLIGLMETTRPEVYDVINTIVKSVQLADPYPFYRVSNLFQRFFLYLTEYLPEEIHDLVLTGGLSTLLMKIFKLSNQ